MIFKHLSGVDRKNSINAVNILVGLQLFLSVFVNCNRCFCQLFFIVCNSLVRVVDMG